MKILICGSTRLRNAEKLNELLDELHEQSAITCVVNGGARGADLLASQWAHSKSITVKRFKIDSAPTKDAFCALNDKMLNAYTITAFKLSPWLTARALAAVKSSPLTSMVVRIHKSIRQRT